MVFQTRPCLDRAKRTPHEVDNDPQKVDGVCCDYRFVEHETHAASLQRGLQVVKVRVRVRVIQYVLRVIIVPSWGSGGGFLQLMGNS